MLKKRFTLFPIITSRFTNSDVECHCRFRVNLHLPRMFLVDIQKKEYINVFIHFHLSEITSFGDFLLPAFFLDRMFLFCNRLLHSVIFALWSHSKSSQICCWYMPNSKPSCISSSPALPSSPLLMSSNSCPSPEYSRCSILKHRGIFLFKCYLKNVAR